MPGIVIFSFIAMVLMIGAFAACELIRPKLEAKKAAEKEHYAKIKAERMAETDRRLEAAKLKDLENLKNQKGEMTNVQET